MPRLNGAARVRSAANGAANVGLRFRLTPFGAIKLETTRAYIIKGIIPREGLVVVWGPPKCGKSFWVFDLVMHAALGWPYRERRVQAGPIVYVACEGERGLGARVEAFRQRHLSEAPEAVPFHLVATRLDLMAEHRTLIDDIRLQIGDFAPVAIVIDTLNRSIAGSESDDADMGAYVEAADAVREAFGCAVIIIHHCGVDDRRPRGHTSLTGAADAQIAVKRDAEGRITATVEFMKDGPEGDQVVSRLEVLEVGLDEDGEPITSCVIVPTEAPAQQPKQGKRTITKEYQKALDYLGNVLADQAEKVTRNGIPANTPVVHVDKWRDHLKQRGLHDGTEAGKKWFQRCRNALIAESRITIDDPYVWIVR